MIGGGGRRDNRYSRGAPDTGAGARGHLSVGFENGHDGMGAVRSLASDDKTETKE